MPRAGAAESEIVRPAVSGLPGWIESLCLWSERVWSDPQVPEHRCVANETILDGDASAPVVVASECSDSGTRLDGFVVTNGLSDNYGGGIYCKASSPIVANCVFSDNTAHESSGGAIFAEVNSCPTIWSRELASNTADTDGGAVSTDYDSSATIVGCTIVDNTAGAGGGVYAFTPGVLRIWDNVISGNEATYGDGGGVYASSGEAVSVLRNSISGNLAQNGGGVSIDLCDSATISDNVIEQNDAVARFGGGIFLNGCSADEITISRNVIQGNTASGGYKPEGGGLLIEECHAPVLVSANRFDSNYGYDHGGGIAMHNSQDVTVANNLFARNHVEGGSLLGGGAIHAKSSAPKIVNNTFIENWVGTGTWPNITPAAYGGAIHVRGTPETKIINNVFLNNRAIYNHGNSVAFTEYGTGSITYCDAFSAVGFTHDNADHGEPGYHYYDYANLVTPGEGCVLPAGIDPDLCDVAGGHYWLKPTSLLHTQYHGQSHGNDSDVPTTDIDGFSRESVNQYTDMGAYESDERDCP